MDENEPIAKKHRVELETTNNNKTIELARKAKNENQIFSEGGTWRRLRMTPWIPVPDNNEQKN